MDHPPAEVWQYTPRQMAAFLFIAGKRKAREQKALLGLYALASRGDPKELKKMLREDD